MRLFHRSSKTSQGNNREWLVADQHNTAPTLCILMSKAKEKCWSIRYWKMTAMGADVGKWLSTSDPLEQHEWNHILVFWEIKQATWIEIKTAFNYLKVNWEQPMIIQKWRYYRTQCRVNSEISLFKSINSWV